MAPAEVSFVVEGDTCRGTHHRAPGDAPRGCLVLGHGFTMSRDAGLDRYAERFAAAGFDALCFDYRCLGDSNGQPRQWLDVGRQLADWRAAIAFARTLEGVDRVALWGTSFSGGHVAALAAEDPDVVAVVSQVPFSGLGGRSGRPRLGHVARMVRAGCVDALAARIGRGPRYVKVVPDDSGRLAAFDVPGAREQVMRLVGDSSTWENRFTPRVVLQMARYRPFAAAVRIRCPWLLVVCDPDTITPADAAVRRAQPAPHLTVQRHTYEHFEVYSGEPFEHLVADQIAFLAPLLTGAPR